VRRPAIDWLQSEEEAEDDQDTKQLKRLWARVFMQAMLDLHKQQNKHDTRNQVQAIRDSARNWFLSDSMGENSFRTVCLVLGFPFEDTRKIVLSMTKEEVHAVKNKMDMDEDKRRKPNIPTSERRSWQKNRRPKMSSWHLMPQTA